VAIRWLIFAGVSWAREIDAILTERPPKPFTTLDQIPDSAEPKAIESLYRTTDPHQRPEDAEASLVAFPGSSLLPQVYEVTAKAYVDLQE
jgi:hypothetical protein